MVIAVIVPCMWSRYHGGRDYILEMSFPQRAIQRCTTADSQRVAFSFLRLTGVLSIGQHCPVPPGADRHTRHMLTGRFVWVHRKSVGGT